MPISHSVPAVIRLMRPGDWFKNVFVLGPLVFALPTALAGTEQETMLAAIVAALIAFCAFCLLTSGFYCINDAFDAAEDRLHPVKRDRPVAAGVVTPRAAIGLGLGLAAAGLTLGFIWQLELGIVLVLYAALQILYNLMLKRVAVLDVLAVATGFGLRAAAGAVAIEVAISMWLLLCVFFLCLFLGFAKRLSNLRSAGDKWKPAAGYEDETELHWLLGIAAVMSVTTFLTYTLSPHARDLFGARALGMTLLTPFVVLAIHRFYRRAASGRSDSPLAAVREDRAVLLSVVGFVIGTAVVLYVPQVPELLGRVFYTGP